MAELKVYLSEDLDKKFRMLAMSIYGFGRGSLSEAAVQALTDWCKKHEAHLNMEFNDEKLIIESALGVRAEERPGIVESERKDNSN